MKATIIYDEHDNIIAISKLVDLKAAGSKILAVGLIPGKGQRKLDVDLTGELASTRLVELHKHYRVNHATSTLVKK
jgi:hypothetical protein